MPRVKEGAKRLWWLIRTPYYLIERNSETRWWLLWFVTGNLINTFLISWARTASHPQQERLVFIMYYIWVILVLGWELSKTFSIQNSRVTLLLSEAARYASLGAIISGLLLIPVGRSKLGDLENH